MRVVCLFSRFNIGGVSKALSFVANSCDEAGMEVHCIAMTPQPETISLNKKIIRHIVDIKEEKTGLNKWVCRASFMLKLRRTIKKISPDVIIVFRADIVKIVVYDTIGLGVPIIASERGNPMLYGKRLNKYRKVFNRCAAAVFQTEDALNLYKVNCKSVIIPNAAITKSNISSTSIRKGKNIITVSRLSKEKNIEGLLRAYSMIKKQLGGRQLIIYGDGPQQDELIAIAKSLKIDDSVIFAGNVKDFTSIDDNSQIFVLNTLSEGMPNALIEAMMSGYACICTDCPIGAPRWLSDNGRRVKLVPVKDDVALAEAIIELANDYELSDSLANNAKEITMILDPKVIANKWVSLVKQIVND
jgi:glycosyltransferase involved in cell wall biosynthesis